MARSTSWNLPRERILRILAFLPDAPWVALDRWMRGREEFSKLKVADAVVVSWGKSGRTWLRMMLTRFLRQKYGLPDGPMLVFDNLRDEHPDIPRILFTHGVYIRDYTRNRESLVDFYGKKLILLVRDPRDVAVSQYFSWRYRMPLKAMKRNGYPTSKDGVSVADFVRLPEVGVPRIVDFQNTWARELDRLQDVHVVRYEDMLAEPDRALERITRFLGTPGTPEQVRDAVEYASFENMRKLEEQQVFAKNGRRLTPGDPDNPDSFKVRRAQVGGYRDYLDDGQIEDLDALVDQTLEPEFGYTGGTSPP